MSTDRRLYRWFYDNVASHYYNVFLKLWFLPFGGEMRVRRTMLKVVPLRQRDRVLDMCCGTGHTTFVIAERAGKTARISAIDLSQGQIRVARKRNRFPNIDFTVMDASKTGFGEGEFDGVVIPHAIHEMPRPLRLEVLKEARRILKDNGILAVLELDDPPSLLLRLFIGFLWFYWLPFNFETPTRRDMIRHGLETELREAGYRDISKTSFYKGALQVVQGRK